MPVERTLSIVKPDGVAANHLGEILAALEAGGLRVVAQRMLRLDRRTAEEFYAIHREKPFYAGLVEFMISGPIVAQVLEGEDAIQRHRALLGATDSRKAAPGTIRARFGTDNQKNACHGSDAPETARREIGFFFTEADLLATRRG